MFPLFYALLRFCYFSQSLIREMVLVFFTRRFIPTRSSVRKVSRTRSVVGTTIDANDCPIEGVKVGTYGSIGVDRNRRR